MANLIYTYGSRLASSTTTTKTKKPAAEVPHSVIIMNEVNDGIITATAASDVLNCESNLKFDGKTLSFIDAALISFSKTVGATASSVWSIARNTSTNALEIKDCSVTPSVLAFAINKDTHAIYSESLTPNRMLASDSNGNIVSTTTTHTPLSTNSNLTKKVATVLFDPTNVPAHRSVGLHSLPLNIPSNSIITDVYGYTRGVFFTDEIGGTWADIAVGIGVTGFDDLIVSTNIASAPFNNYGGSPFISSNVRFNLDTDGFVYFNVQGNALHEGAMEIWVEYAESLPYTPHVQGTP